MRTLIIVFGCCVMCLLQGCYQVQSEDDDLRTIPTTNNPYIIPEGIQGSPIPKAAF